MLTISFPAQAFGTNCYVLADGPGEECLVVDPGIGIEETLREVLAAYRDAGGAEAVTVTDRHEAHALLARTLAPGDVVLLKSSRDSGLRFLGDDLVADAPAGATAPGTTDGDV